MSENILKKVGKLLEKVDELKREAAIKDKALELMAYNLDAAARVCPIAGRVDELCLERCKENCNNNKDGECWIDHFTAKAKELIESSKIKQTGG